MDWLLLGVLGIIWAVFLIPHRGPQQSVEGFERDMDMLSNLHRSGRWILMPRQEERFLGPGSRARARARERRRRVFTVLLEAIGLTSLMGAFPPLRAMWWVTGALIGMLGSYVYLLLRVGPPRAAPVTFAGVAAAPDTYPAGNGYVASNGHQEAPAAAPSSEVADPLPDEEELADAGIRLLAR